MPWTMRRITVVLSFCTLLFPMKVWADAVLLTNQFGSVTLSNDGIVSTGSELTGYSFNRKRSPPGHRLGAVSFSTGALVDGSILGGGTFSDMGSSFVAMGVGKFGVPKGTILSASFFGPIDWRLVSQTGNNYVFELSGNLLGMLFTGRMLEGATTQTIFVTQNQWNQNLKGRIHTGRTALGASLLIPEPGTLLLIGTGLTVIVVVIRSRLFGT